MRSMCEGTQGQQLPASRYVFCAVIVRSFWLPATKTPSLSLSPSFSRLSILSFRLSAVPFADVSLFGVARCLLLSWHEQDQRGGVGAASHWSQEGASADLGPCVFGCQPRTKGNQGGRPAQSRNPAGARRKAEKPGQLGSGFFGARVGLGGTHACGCCFYVASELFRRHLGFSTLILVSVPHPHRSIRPF